MSNVEFFSKCRNSVEIFGAPQSTSSHFRHPTFVQCLINRTSLSSTISHHQASTVTSQSCNVVMTRRDVLRAIIQSAHQTSPSHRSAHPRFPHLYVRPSPPPSTHSHDILGRYRPPFPSITTQSLKHVALSDRDEAFETSATRPMSSSFQQVPPPDQNVQLGHLEIPIPAMKPVSTATPDQQDDQPGKERVVQGVVIPAKPQPPGAEGELSFHGE